MIKIQDLVHHYDVWEPDGEKFSKVVLDGVSLEISTGSFVVILGSNGSGKSTLAKHLNVLLLPDEGTVWVDGKDTKDAQNLWTIRDLVGMVFQNPDNQIVGTSVEEDTAFGPENRNLPTETIRQNVTDSLRAVGLLNKRKVSPTRLSGGQKQRVAIAGVLSVLPSCIVLDEPTAMLDPKSRKEILSIIHRLNKEKGITIVLITHHTDEAVGADSIILMEKGHVLKQGTPREIFGDTELLERVKMDMPQVTQLGNKLKEQGFALKTPILTEEELTEEIMRLYEGTGEETC